MILIILGVVVVTFGFFGAHSIASGWVGARARHAKAQASSLYLFFYYLGSSVVGTAGGVFMGHFGWTGVTLMTGILILIGLVPLPPAEPYRAPASRWALINNTVPRAKRHGNLDGGLRIFVETSLQHGLSKKETDMTITTLSSREFNQDTSRAKKAAAEGPVFITDRGKPAHVLLNIEEYKRITGKRRSIADLLAMPELADIELEIPPRTERAKEVDLS